MIRGLSEDSKLCQNTPIVLFCPGFPEHRTFRAKKRKSQAIQDKSTTGVVRQSKESNKMNVYMIR